MIPFLPAIAKQLVSFVTGGMVDKVLEGWNAYLKKEISKEEFESRVRIAGQETAAKIEASWAEASSRATEAAQEAVSKSPILQRAWAAVLFLQIAVLCWYQVGAPAFLLATGVRWPDPGISLEWAYGLIAAMIGAGPLVLRK